MKTLEKVLVICIAGNTMEYFHATGVLSTISRRDFLRSYWENRC